MNKEYILNKIRPYLNSDNKLGESDFDTLFSMFSRKQQYRIIDVLISENIEIDYENVTKPKPNIPNVQSTVTPISRNLDKLTNEQLCVIYQKGNKLALEQLMLKNEKLVWSRVQKYSRRYKHKLDEEDLVQYGMIGLMKAAERFDLRKDAKFTTYSTWWIDQHIVRSIIDFGFTVRIPVHYFEQIVKIMRYFSQNPGCTKQEIFNLVREEGITKDKFEEILMAAENVMSLTSLNSIIGEDQDSELADFVIDTESQTVEDEVIYTLLRETLTEVLETLSIREQDVIEQRFGLKDGVAKTLEQVGEKYNVTRERIRQIEAKAIGRLRHSTRSKILKSFLIEG